MRRTALKAYRKIPGTATLRPGRSGGNELPVEPLAEEAKYLHEDDGVPDQMK